MRLGELLIRAKVINELQLKTALAEQAKWGGKLGEILVRMEFVTEEVLVRALSKLLNVARAEIDPQQLPPPHVLRKVPHEVARGIPALPLRFDADGKVLVVAMADPTNVNHLDTLRSVSRMKVRPLIAGAAQIARMLAHAYEGEAELEQDEPSFKVVDSQGRTVVKATTDIEQPAASQQPPSDRPAAAAPGPEPRSGAEMVQQLEAAQRKEVSALRAIVDLLIEKGVFTRDEYLSRVRR